MVALGALEAEVGAALVINVVPGAEEAAPEVAGTDVALPDVTGTDGTDVALPDVTGTDVVLPDVAGAVTAGADEVRLDEVDEPLPSHPTRLEPTSISSYQKVLTSPPYDSQPK